MKFFITYSDLKWEQHLQVNTLHCLHTLYWQNYDRKEIVVCYTPPHIDKEFNRYIEKYATIIHRDNCSLPYPKIDFPYGDRFYYTELDDEKVIYVDADIEFQREKDITDFYTDDFDICGYNPSPKSLHPFPHFVELDEYNYLGGHIYFMNHYFQKEIRKKLRETAIRFLNDEIAWDKSNSRVFDEFLTSYIAKDYNYKFLPYDVIPWTDSRNLKDAYILHGGARRIFCAGNQMWTRQTLSESLYRFAIENKVTIGYKHYLERLVAALFTLLEEDNPDVWVWCDFVNNIIKINFLNIETNSQLVDKFEYFWVGFYNGLKSLGVEVEISW